MVAMRNVLLLLLYISHTSAKCGIQGVKILENPKEGLVGNKEFPWVVSLQDPQYSHLAFGCILSEFWILSIASVFQDRKEAVAIVGISRMDSREISHEEYPVNLIIIHEDFNNSTMNNNIALLKTDTAMTFTSLIHPICFLNKVTVLAPTLRNCWVAGWNPTTATGNHMTMSILRRIFVKDMEQCPLNRPPKLGCGNHMEQETSSVCLGDAGNPMMCQLQDLDLWVLQGLLATGGERCPGLFLYIKIDEYSTWIAAKTKGMTPALASSFHSWDSMISFSSSPQTPVTQRSPPGPARVIGSQMYFQDQKGTTKSWPESNSHRNLRDGERNLKMAFQPMYYDYYGGEEGNVWSASGQNRFRWHREVLLICSGLVFFCAGI